MNVREDRKDLEKQEQEQKILGNKEKRQRWMRLRYRWCREEVYTHQEGKKSVLNRGRSRGR